MTNQPSELTQPITLLIYDVKGQCGNCAHVVRDHRLASCDFNRHDFGNAHNCPVYRFDWEDSK